MYPHASTLLHHDTRLNRGATPARVMLGVTTVLTMTTLISSTNASLPKISYVKSIDAYLAFCFFMVFASLIGKCRACRRRGAACQYSSCVIVALHSPLNIVYCLLPCLLSSAHAPSLQEADPLTLCFVPENCFSDKKLSSHLVGCIINKNLLMYESRVPCLIDHNHRAQ